MSCNDHSTMVFLIYLANESLAFFNSLKIERIPLLHILHICHPLHIIFVRQHPIAMHELWHILSLLYIVIPFFHIFLIY